MSSENSVGYKGASCDFAKLLLHHSYLTIQSDGIYVEEHDDIYHVFFEGTLIRQWKREDNKIICFFEEPAILELTSFELDELLLKDGGYFYAPYVPLIHNPLIYNGVKLDKFSFKTRYEKW